MPDGETWTQEYFLDRLREVTGWAPWRTTYSTYERGKSAPRRETLAKFVAFWASYGIEGPSLNPKSPEAPQDPILLLVGELRAWRTEDRRRIEELEATVGRLSKALLDGRGTGGPPGSPARAVSAQ